MTIRIVGMYEKTTHGHPVNTTSKGGPWAGLSPFNIGPCELYDDRVALVHENAWQYSKLYACHADKDGMPTPAYWEWAEAGWANPQAVRYPMGRGASPICSLWAGERFGYIEARKRIYAPLYAAAVARTDSYARLLELYNTGEDLVLRDYDGYDHDAMGLSLTAVLNNHRKKMGHAFVLKMMLTNDPALKLCGNVPREVSGGG